MWNRWVWRFAGLAGTTLLVAFGLFAVRPLLPVTHHDTAISLTIWLLLSGWALFVLALLAAMFMPRPRDEPFRQLRRDIRAARKKGDRN